MYNFSNTFMQALKMEHLLSGYLIEISSMYEDVLVPKLKELQLNQNTKVVVEYYNEGTFVFSIQDKELFQYAIGITEKKYFKPMETFLFVLHQHNIKIETEEFFDCNCDYKISFKINQI